MTYPGQICLAWLVLCTMAMAATNVAVLPFSGDGSLASAQLESITQKYQSELMRIEGLTILERTQMDRILQEQGFQASGACDAASCQVEMGKLLAVDKMVTGSVVQFDDLYAIGTRVLDVQSGVVEQSWFVKVKGSVSDVLDQGCPLAAKQMQAHQLHIAFAPDTLIVGKSVLEREAAAKAAAEAAAVQKASERRHYWTKVSLQAGFVAIAAASLAFGMGQDIASNDAYADYQAVRGTDDPSQASMDKSWAKVEKAETRRNWLYGVSGVSASLLLGTTILF